MASFGSAVTVCVLCAVLVLAVALPSWYSSIRFLGMRFMNGGWLFVVGFVSVLLALRV